MFTDVVDCSCISQMLMVLSGIKVPVYSDKVFLTAGNRHVVKPALDWVGL